MSRSAVMDTALSGLQGFGRFETYLKTAGTVLIAAVCMSIALSVARTAMQDPHDKSTVATLNNVTCTSRTENIPDSKGRTTTRTYYDCVADATYSVGGSTFIKNLTFSGNSSPYQNGSTANVYYNPANAADVVTSQPISEWMAFGASSLSCLIATCAVVWAIFVQKNDFAAGLAGVSGVSDIARGVFKR